MTELEVRVKRPFLDKNRGNPPASAKIPLAIAPVPWRPSLTVKKEFSISLPSGS